MVTKYLLCGGSISCCAVCRVGQLSKPSPHPPHSLPLSCHLDTAACEVDTKKTLSPPLIRPHNGHLN